jgi:hypothetical protein
MTLSYASRRQFAGDDDPTNDKKKGTHRHSDAGARLKPYVVQEQDAGHQRNADHQPPPLH